MQHPRNPFTYGDLVSDEAFTDRETELDQLASDLRNGQNVALIAPRRYGKSSLVKAALRRVHAEGMLVVEVDLMTTPTKERLAAKLAKSIHDDVASSLMKAKEALRFFSTLRVVPDGHRRPGQLGPASRFAASRGSSDIDATIERLLELPAELAARPGPAARRLLRRVPGGELPRSAPAGADARRSSRRSARSRISTQEASAR